MAVTSNLVAVMSKLVTIQSKDIEMNTFIRLETDTKRTCPIVEKKAKATNSHKMLRIYLQSTIFPH